MSNEGAGRTALVTGASAGIGRAFAEVLAERGYGLVLTARRHDRLEEVAASLHATHGIPVHVIAADLADPTAPARIVEMLAAQSLRIDVLINNAGYGVPGRYAKTEWADHQAFLQVMLISVCDLTHRLLPAMVERGWGRIINVASLAGLVPAPAGHTLYAAAKAFLIRFSEALAAENTERGVQVTALCPGFTYSEFHDVLGTRAAVSRMPRVMWMDARTVAEQGYRAVMDGRVVVVNGRLNGFVAWTMRMLPQPVARYVVRRTGRAYRKT